MPNKITIDNIKRKAVFNRQQEMTKENEIKDLGYAIDLTKLERLIWNCISQDNLDSILNNIKKLAIFVKQENTKSYNKGFADGFMGAEEARKLMKKKPRTGGITFSINPKE